MPSNDKASSEQIEKVFEILQGYMPRGATIEQMVQKTGYSSIIIWDAIHTLERDGKIHGRELFAYDPVAATDQDDQEK